MSAITTYLDVADANGNRYVLREECKRINATDLDIAGDSYELGLPTYSLNGQPVRFEYGGGWTHPTTGRRLHLI